MAYYCCSGTKSFFSLYSLQLLSHMNQQYDPVTRNTCRRHSAAPAATSPGGAPLASTTSTATPAATPPAASAAASATA